MKADHHPNSLVDNKRIVLTGLIVVSVIFLLSNSLVIRAQAGLEKQGVSKSAATYNLSGQVTGPDGPIQGVRVFFDCCSNEGMVSTDANGMYFLTTTGPQQGSLIIIPSLETRLGQAARYLTVSSDLSNVDFQLAPGNLLSGRVVNQNGYPANFDHDLYNSQNAKQWLTFNEHAEFMVFLPPDEYHLVIGPPDQNWETHTVDLRNGDITFWEVAITADDEDLPAPPDLNHEGIPPRLDQIQVSDPDINTGTVQLVGNAGAVAPGVSYLDIINLHTGNFTTVEVAADGSFQAQVLAPYGSALQLRNNTWEPRYLRASDTGTILWVYPEDLSPGADGEMSVYLTGRAGDYRGFWTVTGTINAQQFKPGDSFAAELDIIIRSPMIDASFDNAGYSLQTNLNFERFFDIDGTHHTRVQRGISTSFTPTGLPIDSKSFVHESFYTPLTIGRAEIIEAANREGNTLNVHVNLSDTLPDDMPEGIYRPALVLTLGSEGDQQLLASNNYLGVDSLDNRAELGYDENSFPGYMPIITVGNPDPPRLPWAMLVNTFSNGLRGTIAVEEVGLVGLSNRIAFQSDRFVVPRTDLYGRIQHYRLEPFIPTLSSSLASDVEPYPPIIPLKFPAGQLSVQVIRPDGLTENLGTHVFQQARNSMENDRWNYYVGPDRTLQKVYEVTTLSDNLIYSFNRYGKYLIKMTGTVEDIWGNTYLGGGTYELWVAKPLDLEPAVFPGQPFEVGDRLATSVIIHPAVSAKVDLTYALYTAESDPVFYTTSGIANKYGYFQTSDDPFTMDMDGEYSLDVWAEYWDDQGVFWAGSSRGAGVVETPGSGLVAHGLRGITQFTDIRPQWFNTSDIHPSGLKENTAETPEDEQFMMPYPYHTGDILWVPDQSNSIIADLSVDDQSGWYSALLAARNRQLPPNDRTRQTLDERAAIGELPLVTTTDNDYLWRLFPEFVDQWGYAYLSAQRPGVSVRGYVATDNLFRTYWSTDYKYDRQFGNGTEGDRENDIKLQYGGAVIHYGEHHKYLGYASMEVLIPLGDLVGTRTFPPFQGATGGPSGGPILTLKGEDIDLFLTPTGLRPGSILEVGDTVALVGTMWPTLNSKGTFVITSPSGEKHTIASQANRFGYFYAAEGNFQVNEPGVWAVEARLIHDEVVPSTGGGPPAMNNTGDLLGARTCDGESDPTGCGQFYFYVVESNMPALYPNVPREFQLPSSIPYLIEGNVPNGWMNVEGKFTAIMSGFILEEGNLSISNGTYKYLFDPWRLHEDFPNLDITNQGKIGELADTFTLSFFLSGDDDSGKKQHRARSIVLQGQWLQALPQSQICKVHLPIAVR